MCTGDCTDLIIDKAEFKAKTVIITSMGMVGYERNGLRNQVTKNQKNELRISKFNEHEYDGHCCTTLYCEHRKG
jgi:hypothetical protein